MKPHIKPSDWIRKRANLYIDAYGETIESAHDHAIMDFLDEEFKDKEIT